MTKNDKPRFKILFAITVLVIFLLALTHEVLWWDEAVYVNNALAVAGKTENWRFVAWERQPGIYFLEAFALLTFGEIGFLIVALLGAFLLVLLAYRFVFEIGGSSKQAFIAGLLVAVSPPFWNTGFTLASDAWGTVTSLAALFFYQKYLKKEERIKLIAALFLAGISFLFRDVFVLTGAIIVFWEFKKRKMGKSLLYGVISYLLVLIAYLIDSNNRMGNPFGRILLHLELVSKSVGYVFSNPVVRISSWAGFLLACYGLVLYRSAKQFTQTFLGFACAANVLLLLFLDFQLRYALLAAVLLAIVYSISRENHDVWTYATVAVLFVYSASFLFYSFYLGPENIPAMREACTIAKSVQGDLYTVGNAPFLSQCSQRPVYGMEAGCKGGTLLTFREKELFKPYLENCV